MRSSAQKPPALALNSIAFAKPGVISSAWERHMNLGENVSRAEYLPFGRPSFSDREVAAVARVMKSGWVGMGPETIAFEEELAASLAVPHVVTVSSCTSALFLSLLVSGVGRGDEVICPSLTWC